MGKRASPADLSLEEGLKLANQGHQVGRKIEEDQNNYGG